MLTETQQQEIAEAVADTLREQDKGKWKWFTQIWPILLSAIMFIGAAYVGFHRLTNAEEAIVDLDTDKADVTAVEQIGKETDLKLMIMQNDIDHLKDATQEIKQVQKEILQELRSR